MYAMLVAQDDDELAILSLVLQRAGVATTSARTLERALETWFDRPADIFVAALGEGISDLLEAARQIRAVTVVPLVLIASHPVSEGIHVALLKAGADLVISPPFSARLLIAQVQLLLRRGGSVPLVSLPTLTLENLTLDPATRTVQAGARPPARLTHLEFRLLYTLMVHRGQILSTDLIVERVWGYTGEGDRDLVRGLVSRLRSKIEEDSRSPRYIQTVAGMGYAFLGQEE